MSFTLARDGARLTLDLPDARCLADLLLPEELAMVEAGALAADLGGRLLRPDSPIEQGSAITLRPPDLLVDGQPFLYRVNAAGERVRIDELLRLRRLQERTGQELWSASLSELRAALATFERGETRAEFFPREAVRHAARAGLRILPGRPTRRLLPGLGQSVAA